MCEDENEDKNQADKLWFVLELMHDERTDPCIVVLRPGLFVTGFIQNELKLSSLGSFSSWHMNSYYYYVYDVTVPNSDRILPNPSLFSSLKNAPFWKNSYLIDYFFV